MTTEKINPKVSILMAIHNEEPELLEKSVQSLLNQTHDSFELIAIIDGESEENISYLNSLQDNRLKIVVNKENVGLTKALNLGLSIALGEYIARNDSDDFSDPERLKIQSDFLDKNQDHILVASKAFEITEGKQNTQSVPFVSGDELLKKTLGKFNPLTHSSIMVRAKSMRSIGGYDESFRYAQDYKLYVDLMDQGKFENLDQELISRTVASNRISFKHNKDQLRCSLRARQEYCKKRGSSVPILYSILKSKIKLLIS